MFDTVHFFLGNNSGAAFQLSADKQRILALIQAERDPQAAVITVVTNWQTTLKHSGDQVH